MRNNDNYPDFLVGVRCMTYNHHAYIEDAMNGFTMQQTTFPFVCAIIDDASTDGEPDVILRYMNDHFDLAPESGARQWETDEARFLYARHRQNPNCYFGIVLLKTNYYSQHKSKEHLMTQWLSDVKYYALCEGDDYWIEPNKLQMQVDFMESNPDYTLCGTNGLVIWDYGEQPPAYFNDIFESRELKAEDIIGHWVLPTASLFYRKEIRRDYPEWSKLVYSGDQTLQLVSLYKGRLYCFSDLSCVYRKSSLNTTSVSSIVQENYLCEQHILLYTYYDKWTNNKYHDLVSEYVIMLKARIEKMKVEERYKQLQHKNPLLPLITMPKYVLRLKKHDFSSFFKQVSNLFNGKS